jgi:nucleoside-diphosphate-sugar epimerase
MKVIAIGATGFIGRYVVTELIEAGHEVAVVHRGKALLPVRTPVAEILADRSSIAELRTEFRRFSPEVALDMILSSARQARATLEAFHGITRRVVAISSGDVYRAMAVVHGLDSGPLEPVPLTEDSPLRTQSQTYSPEALARARSAFPWIDEEYDKVQVEKAISSDPELPATILRLPMVYGPGDPLHRFYPVVKRISDKRPVILHEQTFAQNVPCRGYVENVAHAIALATTSHRSAGRVYNVADPHPYTEAEWTAKIGASLGWHGRVVAVSRHQAPPYLILPYNFEQHLFMDSTRIRAELGYAECVSVDEGLRRTAEWEQANPPAQIDAAQYDYPAEDEAARRAMAKSAHDPGRKLGSALF